MLPVTTLALGLITIAALASPGVRHQLELSASHRAEPYVELAFARPQSGPPVVCSTSGGTPRVVFEVTSHLAGTEQLDYELVVGRVHEEGSVTVEPGETAQVTRFLGRSTRPYAVAVRLPSVDEELRAHCPGAPR